MKRIIILRRVPGDGGTILTFLEWHPVALGREVPLNPGRSSAYLDAVQDEILAINLGTVIEIIDKAKVPTGATAAQVKATLEAKYAANQAAIDALPNPNQFYGVFWDGTVWSQ